MNQSLLDADTASVQSTPALPKEYPNYQLFGRDMIRDVGTSRIALVVAFLGRLDPQRLALVLTLVGLVVIGTVLAWPGSAPSGYRVLGAVGVAVLLGAIGLAALYDWRRANATQREGRADEPADSGLGGAGPEGARPPAGPDPGG